MGLNADAELIWGIPVVAFSEDDWDDERGGYPVTPFWDPEAEDWREFEGELEVVSFGHYEDPDNHRGILTSTRMERYSADCWDPAQITPMDLGTEMNRDKTYSKSNDQARAAGLDVNFYADAGWWLVASYG
jgi:hypothetical protein